MPDSDSPIRTGNRAEIDPGQDDHVGGMVACLQPVRDGADCRGGKLVLRLLQNDQTVGG